MQRLEIKSTRTIIGAFLMALILSSTSAFAQDVYIKDCPGDAGATGGGYVCGGGWYLSPDVVLTTTPTASTTQNAPVAYQPAWIHVTLRNGGAQPSCCGTVSVYYRDASTGLSTYPTNWTYIGSQTVCNIPAGGLVTAPAVFWPSVPPNATPGQHYCLLAVWDAPNCDPVSTSGPVSIYTFVPGDNNVAHKNCLPTTPGCPRRSFSVFNIGPDQHIRLRLKAHRHDNGKTLFDIPGFRVKVILGADLMGRWDGGGENIEQVAGEPDALFVTGEDALIDGLNLPGGDETNFTNFVVFVEVQYPDAAALEAEGGAIYTWTLTQEDDDHPDGVDGMGFEIHTAEDPGAGGNGDGGKRVVAAAPDLAASLQLSVRPNITSGSSVISFVLPERANVSLMVYDASGRLVRTLLTAAERQAGAGEIEWDGRSSDGAAVANGTYFYRLTTPAGTAERQIKIVR